MASASYISSLLENLGEDGLRALIAEGIINPFGLRNWRIRRDFERLKSSGVSAGRALEVLAEAYNISRERVKDIVYRRKS